MCKTKVSQFQFPKLPYIPMYNENIWICALKFIQEKNKRFFKDKKKYTNYVI